MTDSRRHECECLVDGCRCVTLIACSPGADWCDDCEDGRHSAAIEACGHVGCGARAWSNGWCFGHQEEGGFARPPTMRGSR